MMFLKLKDEYYYLYTFKLTVKKKKTEKRWWWYSREIRSALEGQNWCETSDCYSWKLVCKYVFIFITTAKFMSVIVGLVKSLLCWNPRFSEGVSPRDQSSV